MSPALDSERGRKRCPHYRTPLTETAIAQALLLDQIHESQQRWWEQEKRHYAALEPVVLQMLVLAGFEKWDETASVELVAAAVMVRALQPKNYDSCAASKQCAGDL